MRCDWSLNNVAKEPQLDEKVSPIVLPRRMHNYKYNVYHVFTKQFFSCLRPEQIYFFLGLSPEIFSGYVFRAYAHYHNQIYSLFIW